MKQLTSLSIEDLEQVRIWECHGESDPLAFVKPTSLDSLKEHMPGVYIAATKFTFADGTTCFGYCSPQDSSGVDYMQPVLLIGNEGVRLWADEDTTKEGLLRRLSGGQLTEAQVFPLQMECLIEVDGQTVERSMEASEFVWCG